MKKLLSIALCLLLLAGCAETYDGPTAEKTVCSRKITTFYDPDGTATQQELEEYAYDLRGNRAIIRAYRLSPDTGERTFLSKTALRYDEDGNVLRQSIYDSAWLPFPAYTYTYTYDDRGRQTSSASRRGWEKVTFTTVYDDEAMTRTVTAYGSVATDYLNDRGWVLRTEQSFSDGRTELTEYDRSADGTLLSMRSYADGTLTREIRYTYDDQGRPLTQTSVENGASTLLFSWEYGENHEKQTYSDGHCVTSVFNEDGTIQYSYQLDANDRLVFDSYYYYTEIQVPAEEVSP